MTATITLQTPIIGPADDKSDPSAHAAWLEFRRGGITATQIRDWGNPTRRRKIITEKVTGEFEDLSHIPAVNHGTLREPIIADWARQRFGIQPTNAVFAHPENPRHLASPDGVAVNPFTGALVTGSEAVLLEIKTSAHDLLPGRLDAHNMLVEVKPGSAFDRANYYTQVQWQMYVMNAAMTLFVWERHTGRIDPETGTFTPDGPPQWAWIPRDQTLIDVLESEVAPAALAEIDAAMVGSMVGSLPPASDLPSEHAVLVAQLLKARDAEAVAVAAKEQAWKALQDLYLAEGAPDVSIDGGFARVTVSTSSRITKRFDEDAARDRAPALMAKYDALRARYTKAETVTRRSLTITPKSESG